MPNRTPRRELLTPAQREQLLAFPADAAELIRLYTLSDADHAFIKAHRGVHNRLGISVQLAYLRFPGQPIARGEEPQPQGAFDDGGPAQGAHFGLGTVRTA